MSTYDHAVILANKDIFTPNELKHGIMLIDKDVDVRRIDRQVRREKLNDLLTTIGDQCSVDIFLKEDPNSFNTCAVFIRSRDLCNKVGVRILFTYDEIFYGSHEDIIREIISAIAKMKEPIEKPTPVKVCTDKFIPRLCTCCNAPLPAHSNTCEYCGVSYENMPDNIEALTVKMDGIIAQKSTEQLYADAIRAMQSYRGIK